MIELDNTQLLMMIFAAYAIIERILGRDKISYKQWHEFRQRATDAAEATPNPIDDAIAGAGFNFVERLLQRAGLFKDVITIPAPVVTPAPPVIEPTPSVELTLPIDIDDSPAWSLDVPFIHRASGKVGNRHVDFPFTMVHVYDLHDVEGKEWPHPEVHIKEEYRGARFAIAQKGGKWGYYAAVDMQPDIPYRISLAYSADVTFDGANNLYWILTVNGVEEEERRLELGDNRQAVWLVTSETVVQTVSIQLFAKYANAQDESYVTWHHFSVHPTPQKN